MPFSRAISGTRASRRPSALPASPPGFRGRTSPRECSPATNTDGSCSSSRLTSRSWRSPGGLVEDGESPLAACRREVGEELGIDVPVGRLLVVDWRRLAGQPAIRLRRRRAEPRADRCPPPGGGRSEPVRIPWHRGRASAIAPVESTANHSGAPRVSGRGDGLRRVRPEARVVLASGRAGSSVGRPLPDVDAFFGGVLVDLGQFLRGE
ncbi:NUDIX domain-containing protein [Amycolatopsis rubida]|uniref:NUDIX domain-containing protein n=1 Tax=Amycolatopsis rubida TaxID=112413 RepID=UPI001AD82174|nr:NUDIX hydrolase [Amycolatopsis rubida]